MQRSTLEGRSILVVEDVVMDITQAFEGTGAALTTTNTLHHAMILAEHDGLSSAILDHSLGDGNSSLLYARLKERGIPFMIYSGFDTGGVCEGAVHIRKPAAPGQLVAAMERLCWHSPQQQALPVPMSDRVQNIVVNLNEEVLCTLGTLRSSLGEGIALSASLTPRLGAVRVDPSAMQKAILHLVANARIYAERDSLLIATENINLDTDAACAELGLSLGDYVCLTISDTDTGIVAEPMMRSLPSDCRMGLFIDPVYAFAKQSGGTATIHSGPGRGTTVRLYLPRLTEETVPFA